MADLMARLAAVSRHAASLSPRQFDTEANTPGEFSQIASYTADAVLGIRTGRDNPLRVAIPAFQSFTTDGTAGNTETFNLGHDLVDAVAVADDFVFVTDSPATLNAFDRADGTRRWTYDVGARYGLAPVVAGDTVFPSATDGAVRALDFDGNERWTVEMEGLALSPPLVLDDRVFVARDLSTHIEMVALA